MRRSVALCHKHPKVHAKKAVDNTPLWDKGPVEWIPRPIRITYATIDELQQTIMRQTIDGKWDDINRVREAHRQWSQTPLKPVLGDVEPKFPRGVYKHSHLAHTRFKYRWHKANHPMQWGWLPKTGKSPHRWSLNGDNAENWKVLRSALVEQQ